MQDGTASDPNTFLGWLALGNQYQYKIATHFELKGKHADTTITCKSSHTPPIGGIVETVGVSHIVQSMDLRRENNVIKQNKTNQKGLN